MNGWKDCLARMREAPWGRIVFGEEPHLAALLLLAGGFVFTALLPEAWPLVLAILAAAALVNAWRWCRARRTGQMADGEDWP